MEPVMPFGWISLLCGSSFGVGPSKHKPILQLVEKGNVYNIIFIVTLFEQSSHYVTERPPNSEYKTLLSLCFEPCRPSLK